MDINTRGSSYPARFTVFDGWLYFSATHTASGTELWRTNGSVTQLLSGIVPGAAPSGFLMGTSLNLLDTVIINTDERCVQLLWRAAVPVYQRIYDIEKIVVRVQSPTLNVPETAGTLYTK